jgi:hypothetical protein
MTMAPELGGASIRRLKSFASLRRWRKWPVDALDDDLTACRVGIMGLELGERSLGCEHIDQTLRDAAMERADNVRALDHCVAVRAIAKPTTNYSFRIEIQLWLEAERGQDGAEALEALVGVARCKLVAYLPTGPFDLAQAGRSAIKGPR